jgi:hypothetical protein
MKTETLHNKLERYLNGVALPAETRQIQTWLSCTDAEEQMNDEEKLKLENEILGDIRTHTSYPLFYPKKEEPWWQKITALF